MVKNNKAALSKKIIKQLISLAYKTGVRVISSQGKLLLVTRNSRPELNQTGQSRRFGDERQVGVTLGDFRHRRINLLALLR